MWCIAWNEWNWICQFRAVIGLSNCKIIALLIILSKKSSEFSINVIHVVYFKKKGIPHVFNCLLLLTSATWKWIQYFYQIYHQTSYYTCSKYSINIHFFYVHMYVSIVIKYFSWVLSPVLGLGIIFLIVILN